MKKPTLKDKAAVFENICLQMSLASQNRDMQALARIGTAMAKYANSQVKDRDGKMDDARVNEAFWAVDGGHEQRTAKRD